MDNRELIERANAIRGVDDCIIRQLTDALERAEAELAKYRSAPPVAYVNMAITGIELSLIGRVGWLPLIIRPEEP